MKTQFNRRNYLMVFLADISDGQFQAYLTDEVHGYNLQVTSIWIELTASNERVIEPEKSLTAKNIECKWVLASWVLSLDCFSRYEVVSCQGLTSQTLKLCAHQNTAVVL
jgi:hypothetical protein